MPLQAFHGKRSLKAKYLAQVRAHAKADEIIHGTYWEHGKGCAVGCTVHRSERVHAQYEPELGIPQALAALEDRIFEGMANGRAKQWPAQFLSAIRVGAELSGVLPQFLLAVQERRYAALGPIAKQLVGEAMQQVIAVLRSWAATGTPNASAASAAASAAWSAAESAASAAASAAWSAASAAASAAWSAAESAAWSAAASAASAEYEWQADTLLALLRAARKVTA